MTDMATYNIVLIGMSGSGKTRTGRYLSKKLNLEFLDTDDLIIFKSKRTVQYIFDQYGEEYFRILEANIIKDLAPRTGMVISTGGGVILNEENIKLLKQNGIIFFLKANTETLAKNIKSSSRNRPLLVKDDNLKKKIEKMYSRRKESYISSADYIIHVDNKSVIDIADEIIYILNK